MDLNDYSPNTNTLTNSNATDSGDVPFGGSTASVNLERDNAHYLYASDSASLSITGDITCEAWIKLESLPTGDTQTFTVVSKYHATGDNISYLFCVRTDALGDIQVGASYSDDGSTADDLNVAWTPNTGTWYHVAWVIDVSESQLTAYVNGSSIGTDTGSKTSIIDKAANLEIGSFQAGTESFDGLIDDVRLWDDIRTEGEISANYQKKLTGLEANLQAYYPFEPPMGGSFLINFL